MSESNTHGDSDAGRDPNSVFDRRDWLQITLASIGDGVITADALGRVNYLNPVAEMLTGWTLAEATGREVEQVFRIVNETTRKPVEQPVRIVIERGLTVGLGNHTLLIARDGRERPIDDSAAPITDGRGQVVGVVLIFRDITQRRQGERLIEAAREYAESIVTRSVSRSSSSTPSCTSARPTPRATAPSTSRPPRPKADSSTTWGITNGISRP